MSKRVFWGTSNMWNSILFVSVLFAAFILPLTPLLWQKSLGKLVYAIMYFAAILSLKKRSTILLILFVTTLILLWVSSIFDFQLLENFSKAFNVIMFLVIVFLLLRQIVMAKDVSVRVILESIMGYLLLGIIYSIFITLIMRYEPASYSKVSADDSSNLSVSLYYSYITLASVGYGDMVPLKPYTRSLATWIAVSGQFYVTIIVALIVGKYSATKDAKSEKEITG